MNSKLNTLTPNVFHLNMEERKALEEYQKRVDICNKSKDRLGTGSSMETHSLSIDKNKVMNRSEEDPKDYLRRPNSEQRLLPPIPRGPLPNEGMLDYKIRNLFSQEKNDRGIENVPRVLYEREALSPETHQPRQPPDRKLNPTLLRTSIESPLNPLISTKLLLGTVEEEQSLFLGNETRDNFPLLLHPAPAPHPLEDPSGQAIGGLSNVTGSMTGGLGLSMDPELEQSRANISRLSEDVQRHRIRSQIDTRIRGLERRQLEKEMAGTMSTETRKVLREGNANKIYSKFSDKISFDSSYKDHSYLSYINTTLRGERRPQLYNQGAELNQEASLGGYSDRGDMLSRSRAYVHDAEQELMKIRGYYNDEYPEHRSFNNNEQYYPQHPLLHYDQNIHVDPNIHGKPGTISRTSLIRGHSNNSRREEQIETQGSKFISEREELDNKERGRNQPFIYEEVNPSQYSSQQVSINRHPRTASTANQPLVSKIANLKDYLNSTLSRTNSTANLSPSKETGEYISDNINSANEHTLPLPETNNKDYNIFGKRNSVPISRGYEKENERPKQKYLSNTQNKHKMVIGGALSGTASASKRTKPTRAKSRTKQRMYGSESKIKDIKTKTASIKGGNELLRNKKLDKGSKHDAGDRKEKIEKKTQVLNLISAFSEHLRVCPSFGHRINNMIKNEKIQFSHSRYL